MDKFYQNVAEKVMSTYKDKVKLYGGKDRHTDLVDLIDGFEIMGKKISYDRINNDRILMSLIIPRIKKEFLLTDRQGKRVYYLLEDGLKKRVKMRLMLQILNAEMNKKLHG